MSRFFIGRPIFSMVLSILLVIMGMVSLAGLPVAQFPEIAPPVIQALGLDGGVCGALVEVTNGHYAQPRARLQESRTRGATQPIMTVLELLRLDPRLHGRGRTPSDPAWQDGLK